MSKQTAAPTFWANIYCGLQVGYTDDVVPKQTACEVIEDFCDAVGLCVTVSDTEFIYSDGQEHGIVVSLINYPRFPKPVEQLKDVALRLAKMLQEKCFQNRVSVMFPDETVMLGEAE